MSFFLPWNGPCAHLSWESVTKIFWAQLTCKSARHLKFILIVEVFSSLDIISAQKISMAYSVVIFNSLRPSDSYIYISKLTISGSDYDLSPDRCKVIDWTNAEILLIGPLGTNFSEIIILIQTFSFKKWVWKYSWKMAAIFSRPQCFNSSPSGIITAIS